MDYRHNNKYITTKEFRKLNSKNFGARLTQAKLATRAGIADFIRKADF